MAQDKHDIPVADAVAAKGGFLEGVNGVLFRQDAQLAEVVAQLIGLPCEKANRYKFAPFPAGRRAIQRQGDAEGWSPSQAEIDSAVYTINAQEESSCFTNFLFYLLGCVNFRPFTMNFAPMGSQGPATYQLERPFTCGGVCCCPHNLELKKDGQVIGKVVEDWDCSNYICRFCEASYCCKVPYKLQLVQDGQLVNRYNITYNLFICGDHNNCCGATPFRQNMLFNLYNYNAEGVDRSAAAGHIQKTYGDACGLDSLIRFCCAQAGQYLVEWPASSTADEKALVMAAAVLMEYIFFENTGSE